MSNGIFSSSSVVDLCFSVFTTGCVTHPISLGFFLAHNIIFALPAGC